MDGVNIPLKMCGLTDYNCGIIPWLLFATGSLSLSWPVTLMIVLQFHWKQVQTNYRGCPSKLYTSIVYFLCMIYCPTPHGRVQDDLISKTCWIPDTYRVSVHVYYMFVATTSAYYKCKIIVM